MELLTLVRFRSNVELIRRPKPSNLICQGLKFLLFICIYIKIFTFENYEEPFIVKVSYCHIKLVTAWGGIFGFSWAVTSFGRIFCSVVTYYLLTTFFFFVLAKGTKRLGQVGCIYYLCRNWENNCEIKQSTCT